MYAYFLSVKQSDASFCPSHKKNKNKKKKPRNSTATKNFESLTRERAESMQEVANEFASCCFSPKDKHAQAMN